jgi:hypothetical protein
MKVVKAVKRYGHFNAGEVFGLPDKEAEDAIKKKKCMPFPEEPAPKPAPEEEPEEEPAPEQKKRPGRPKKA